MKIDTPNCSRSIPECSSTNPTFAHCGSENTIPIVYGYPSSNSMDAFLEANRREIRMGGCCVNEGMPTYHCKDCQRDSGHLVLRERG